MSDNRTDAAEIDWRIDLLFVEGWLKYARGKVDVVHQRVVIGVYRRRGHAPFTTIGRPADLVQLALEFELIGAGSIAKRVVPVDRDTAVIAPPVRVPDFVG